MNGSWTAAIIVAALMVSGPSLADEPVAPVDPVAQAREHMRAGIELLEEKEVERAIEAFLEAHRLHAHYSILYNLGLAYVLDDSPVAAVDAFERYLAEGGDTIALERRSEVLDELARQRARIGAFAFRLIPADAIVEVDGARVDTSSPVRVAAGKHRVRARRAGFLPFERSVEVAAGVETAVDVQLEPEASIEKKAGMLAVVCPVPDVQVQLDEEHVRALWRAPVRVPAGTHDVVFSRPGYVDSRKEVQIHAGKVHELRCDLRPVTPLPKHLSGTLRVTAMPTNANILVDGLPLQSSSVVIGRHDIVVRSDGYRTWRGSVVVDSGGTSSLHTTLEPVAGRDAPDSGVSAAKVTAYALTGAGVGLGIATVAVAVWNDGRFDEWQDEQSSLDAEFPSSQPGTTQHDELSRRQRDNDELLSSVQDVDPVAIGMGIGATAMVIGGLSLWLLTVDDGPQLSMAALPGGGALRGTW